MTDLSLTCMYGAATRETTLLPSTVTRPLGAEIFEGHSAENIKDIDLVVYSSAVNIENSEVKEALDRSFRNDGETELVLREQTYKGTMAPAVMTADRSWTLRDVDNIIGNPDMTGEFGLSIDSFPALYHLLLIPVK